MTALWLDAIVAAAITCAEWERRRGIIVHVSASLVAVKAKGSATTIRIAMAFARETGLFQRRGSWPIAWVPWPSLDKLYVFADRERWPQSRLETYSQLAEHIIEALAGKPKYQSATDAWAARLSACRAQIARAP